MKKRVFGIMLVVCMLFAQLTAVSAAPSKSGDFNVITDGYNVGVSTDASYANNIPAGMTQLSDVFTVTGNGSSSVTFYVPGLSSNITGPIYAYVTYADGTTVVLEATSVDYANGTVTFDFDVDKLPATVVLYAELSSVEAVGESPKTGVMSTWAVWFALAGVFAVAAFASRKSRA